MSNSLINLTINSRKRGFWRNFRTSVRFTKKFSCNESSFLLLEELLYKCFSLVDALFQPLHYFQCLKFCSSLGSHVQSSNQL